MTPISFRWHGHGLGDSVHLCHLIQLWRARGYSFEIACDPDFAPLFELAGARIVDHAEQSHPWMHPFPGPLLEPVWSGNKILANLRSWPLPAIGRSEDLWEELLGVQLRWPESPAASMGFRPLIVCHFRGINGPQEKDLPDWMVVDFQKRLIPESFMSQGACMILSENTPDINHPRVGLGGPYTLDRLLHLLGGADLVIGIDSGPLHACRLTDTPALGVWTEHRPWHYALPRERTVNLVPEPTDEWRMNAFQCVAVRREDYPEAMVDHVRMMLT